MPSFEINIENLQDLIEASLIINIGDVKELAVGKKFTKDQMKISKDANIHVRLLECYVKNLQSKFFELLEEEFSLVNLNKIGKNVISVMLMEEQSCLPNFNNISEWLIIVLLDYLKFDINQPIYNGSLLQFAIENEYYELMEYLFDNNLDFIDDKHGDFVNEYGNVIDPNFVEWFSMYCEERGKQKLFDKFCYYMKDYEYDSDQSDMSVSECYCTQCDEEEGVEEEDDDMPDCILLEISPYKSCSDEVVKMFKLMNESYDNYNVHVSDMCYDLLMSELKKNRFSDQIELMKKLNEIGNNY